MAFEHKDGHGSLFRNDKGDNPLRPDYKGSAKINGVDVEIAGWLKDGKNGKFLSLAIKEQDNRPAPVKQAEDSFGSVSYLPDDDLGSDFDEDIPFAPHERGWVS